MWKVRSQGMSGYQHIEGPPPKGYGLEEGEKVQVLNFMPHFRKVMTKVGLADAAKRYMRATDTEWPSFLPISLILSPFWSNLDENGNHPLKSSQFQDFLDIHRQCARGSSQHMKNHCDKNMWLIKPAAANRGIGIEIFSKISEVKQFLREKERWKEHWIIQKYIERPLLLEKRKFDIRAWMLLTTAKDGTKAVEAYIYDEWYVRLSSEEYQTDSFDRYIHLTNWSVQKKHSNFGKYEDGNTWTMKMFRKYLSNTDIDFDTIKSKIEAIMRTMCDIVFTCEANDKKQIGSNPNDNRRDNFEILGFDFMVDDIGDVWMLEINGNPSLSYQNKSHETLVKSMIGNLIDLTMSRALVRKNQQNNFKLIFNSSRDFNRGDDNETKSSSKRESLPSITPQHRFVVTAPKNFRAIVAENNKNSNSKNEKNSSTYKKWVESDTKATNRHGKLGIAGGTMSVSKAKAPAKRKKKAYKFQKKHPSIVERSVREAKLRFVERQLLESKVSGDDMNLNIEREHIIPYVCSPIFVPPCNNDVPRKRRKAFRNGIGRKNVQSTNTYTEKIYPLTQYQVQRRRRPYLQFFETAEIRAFLKSKQIPKPIKENKWFKTLKAKQTLSLPRPWSQNTVVPSRQKVSIENDLVLDPSHRVTFRVQMEHHC